MARSGWHAPLRLTWNDGREVIFGPVADSEPGTELWSLLDFDGNELLRAATGEGVWIIGNDRGLDSE